MTPVERPPAQTSEPRTTGSRVLVVGASGFLGRAVVRALADHGHEVHGLVRDSAKGERVRESGGVPFIGDILDLTSLRAAAKGCTFAIHLAAHPSRDEDATTVRVEGTRRLIETARSEGLTRLVIGSGYWVYGSQSDPITEESPVDPQGESKDDFEAERVGLRANSPGGLAVLVVRPGMVYGDGSWFRSLALSIRSGEYSVVGDGTNRWSFVALPDTASAFVQVLATGVGGEVYNVVDGQPAPLREFVDFVAAQLGGRPPPSISLEEAAAENGEVIAHHLAADRPTSNQKLVSLGWRPSLSSYRDGIPSVVREIFPRSSSRGR
jgi:nucleoside-diphosphate-sugar epimerase